MMPTLLKRFPPRADLIAFFSFAAFLVYVRMLFFFAWKLPSWLYILTANEILSTLAYSLAFSFLESLGYTALFAIICFLLPISWFKARFVPRAVWAMTVWMISWSLFFSPIEGWKQGGVEMAGSLFIWLVVTLLLAGFAAFAGARFPVLTRSGEWLADSTLVFLFLLVPASLISLIVIIIRNLS